MRDNQEQRPEEENPSQTVKTKKNKRIDDLTNVAITGAAYDSVQRYGAAVKEHLVAYSGTDNETGQKLSKSLKSISQSKVDPNNQQRNIKQQSGFSAEVKSTARHNAEAAIQGKTNRTTRTDDMRTQSDGKGGTIGGTNEQYYDLAEVDKNGIYVEGSGRQLKFVGGTPKECASKLLSKKYDKYIDKGVDIEVPSDYYDKVQKELSAKAENVKKQLEKAQSSGNSELAKKLEQKLKRIEETKTHLKKSNVSNKEAVFAREHPKLSTAQDIVKVSHRAGLEGAKMGAMIGGGVSLVKNTVAYIKGEITVKEAAVDTAKSIGKSAGNGYVIEFSGSALKGAMQNSSSTMIHTLSKTNLPAALVNTAVSTGKTMTRFARGEIDGTECIEELGKNGTTMIASSMGAVVGQAAIPIPVVGALIGSMVGYALASASYDTLTQSLKEAKLAHERRVQIEAECAEHIALIREYRAELEQLIQTYLAEKTEIFYVAFADMKNALQIGDVDGFISGTNSITRALGGVPEFETMDEFESLMQSEIPFSL